MRKYDIDSPTDRQAIKQVSREEYPSAVKSIQKKVEPEKLVAEPVKTIMGEIETICSTKNASVFRDNDKALTHFNWESLWSELASKAPTLLHMYRKLFRGAGKPLICFAISMIIKYRSPKKMGVVQRAISTVMYGNGANKQVSVLFMMLFSLLVLPTIQLYNCLQPLMVCLSYNGTIKHINHLAANFDDPVLKWRDRLTQNVQVECTSIQSCYWFIAMMHFIGLYWKKKCQGFMDWSTYHRC